MWKDNAMRILAMAFLYFQTYLSGLLNNIDKTYVLFCYDIAKLEISKQPSTADCQFSE